MEHLLEQAKNLISLNRLIDSQILLLSLLNSKEITINAKEHCLSALLEIAKKLGKEKDIEKYNASLAQVYFEQKKYRRFLDIYNNQDMEAIHSNYILKSIVISFLQEGEINNFTLALNKLMNSLEACKLFNAAESLIGFLEKAIKQEEIDEYIFPFLLQKGDDKKIAEILNRCYEKCMAGSGQQQRIFRNNIMDLDKYYKKKVAPESFYVLYLENNLNTEKKTGELGPDQYLKILKIFFDGHVYYPDSFEIAKKGLEIALRFKDKKLGQSLLNIIDRKFKNLKKSQNDHVKLKKMEIKNIDEDGIKLEKKLQPTPILLNEEKEIEVKGPQRQAPENDNIDFIKARGSRNTGIVTPSAFFLEMVSSENYGDIFSIFHSLEEYDICQKVLNNALLTVCENTDRSRKLQFKDKINIEYLRIESYMSMGLYHQVIQTADKVISSMPLDLEDKIVFWYLIAEAKFQLKEFQSAASFFYLIRDHSENYRLVKIRISQIEQAE